MLKGREVPAPVSYALPLWLPSISAQSMGATTVPLREILDGALYYPPFGVDGCPVQHMGGITYPDYSTNCVSTQ